jgi:uncharacterized protein YjfI (DUF2170 family)
MNEKVPLLISDNSLDVSSAKDSVSAVATDIVKDLQDGQFLVAGAKLKMLEETAKMAKEFIKDKMSEEFELRNAKMVPIGSIEIRQKSRQDKDYTTCMEFNRIKKKLDRIKEKMDICDREYFDDELKANINPPALKDPIVYIEFKLK